MDGWSLLIPMGNSGISSLGSGDQLELGENDETVINEPFCLSQPSTVRSVQDLADLCCVFVQNLRRLLCFFLSVCFCGKLLDSKF